MKNNLTVPVAIIIAGTLIAGAVYFSASGDGVTITPQQQAVAENISGLENMNPVEDSDHIRGNPNAPVKIVEYVDMECPFCKRFHSTMQKVMDEYGKDGKVAWVYRHFPLDSIHSQARTEAVASECANELGGNDAFWKYTDRFFELTPSNNQTNIATVLPQIAREIGLDETKFNSCLASKKYDKHIQDDLDNATATGGNGTPWSIVITANGKKYPLSGAQPYEAVKQLVELALQEK
ncbi:MAG: thioredoxin domain-containing protein [Candidatus Taylorbacteria bacterium]|nr:thioredoxin domain-containing protein [Candidatus Taylorbacteria bacterium]